MPARRFVPSASLLVVAVALVVGLAAPAMAHQAKVVVHKISGSTIKANTVTGKQVKESTLATVPSAKLAKSLPPLVWHPLTNFTNGWQSAATPGTAVSPGFRPPAYAIDAQGIVHLRGAVLNNASPIGPPSQVLVLPPAAAIAVSDDLYLPTVLGGAEQGSINITGSKLSVDLSSPATIAAAADYTSLDGLTYSP